MHWSPSDDEWHKSDSWLLLQGYMHTFFNPSLKFLFQVNCLYWIWFNPVQFLRAPANLIRRVWHASMDIILFLLVFPALYYLSEEYLFMLGSDYSRFLNVLTLQVWKKGQVTKTSYTQVTNSICVLLYWPVYTVGQKSMCVCTHISYFHCVLIHKVVIYQAKRHKQNLSFWSLHYVCSL